MANKQFENEINERIDEKRIDMSVIDVLALNGYHVCSYKRLDDYEDTVVEVSKRVVRNINKAADLLGVISRGIDVGYDSIKYKLFAPYTTAKIDVNYVLKQLLHLEIINDFYYSEVSNSFSIEVNKTSSLKLQDVYRIGLSGYFDSSIQIFLDIVIDNGSYMKGIDISFILNDELNLLHMQIDSEFEYNSDIQKKLVNELRHNVVNERLKLNSINCNELWVVSDITKIQLSPLNNVLGISDVCCR